MTIDYEQLMAFEIPESHQTFDEKDCILYALGIGLGSDPLDPRHLRHVCEDALVPFPVMAVVLAMGGSWARLPGTGIDFTQLLHAEQDFRLHRPLPVRGTITGRSRVVEIIDKGSGRGAIATTERQLFLDEEDMPFATLRSSSFCRGDGGFGGPVTASPKPQPMPDRDPDAVLAIPTLPQAALIYRLSGDYNELHSHPAVAAHAGFRAPILHGLCSFGVACRAVIEGLDLDPETVEAAGVRFTAPVYPGETLETSIWREPSAIAFRTRIVERDLTALNHGWLHVR